MSPQQKAIVIFMQNSLVEMFGINEGIAYQHAFVYIRQLAIHLRNAIIVKKKVCKHCGRFLHPRVFARRCVYLR